MSNNNLRVQQVFAYLLKPLLMGHNARISMAPATHLSLKQIKQVGPPMRWVGTGHPAESVRRADTLRPYRVTHRIGGPTCSLVGKLLNLGFLPRHKPKGRPGDKVDAQRIAQYAYGTGHPALSRPDAPLGAATRGHAKVNLSQRHPSTT